MNGCFSVNGRLYSLRFTVNHICCLEEALGEKFPALLSGSVWGMRALIWCGLMEEKLSLEEAGDLLQAYLAQGGTLQALSQILADAMEDAGFFHSPARKQET